MALRDEIYVRADGQCECRMSICNHHTRRCPAVLRCEWEVYRITPGGPYMLSNVIGVCQKCYANIQAMGSTEAITSKVA